MRARDLVRDNVSGVRRRNRAAVLEIILREPHVSRREIIQRTGLAAGAVTDITRELINKGLVQETSYLKRDGGGAGRSPIGLEIVKDAAWVIGILVEADRITACLCNAIAEIDCTAAVELDNSSVDHVQVVLTELANEMLGRAAQEGKLVIGMGVSVPGMVTPDKGLVGFSTILGWQDVQLGNRLRKGIPIPIAIDNDVRGMGLAKYWYDKSEYDSFLMLYFGQGIAFCAVQDGEIWTGHSGAAGQIGHSIVEPDGPQCTCGNKGCFEAVVSADMIQSLIADEIAGGAESHLKVTTPGAGRLQTRHLCELLETGDEAVRNVFRRISKYYGIAISNLIKAYDCEAVVLSGDLFSESDFFASLVKKETQRLLLRHQMAPHMVVDGDPQSRLRGSAVIALHRFIYRPSLPEDVFLGSD
jgi:N-acetylglucosamine repressor